MQTEGEWSTMKRNIDSQNQLSEQTTRPSKFYSKKRCFKQGKHYLFTDRMKNER